MVCSFFFEDYSVLWLCHDLFIPSPADGYLSFFPVLSYPAESCYKHVRMCLCEFVSFHYSWLQGWLGRMVDTCLFSLFKKLTSCFPQGYRCSFPQQCVRGCFLYIFTNWILFVFLMFATLMGVHWYVIVICICILWWLMMLSALPCASWPFLYFANQKCLPKSFAHFKSSCLCLYYWVVRGLHTSGLQGVY